jgi:hypothetical protein
LYKVLREMNMATLVLERQLYMNLFNYPCPDHTRIYRYGDNNVERGFHDEVWTPDTWKASRLSDGGG